MSFLLPASSVPPTFSGGSGEDFSSSPSSSNTSEFREDGGDTSGENSDRPHDEGRSLPSPESLPHFNGDCGSLAISSGAFSVGDGLLGGLKELDWLLIDCDSFLSLEDESSFNLSCDLSCDFSCTALVGFLGFLLV